VPDHLLFPPFFFPSFLRVGKVPPLFPPLPLNHQKDSVPPSSNQRKNHVKNPPLSVGPSPPVLPPVLWTFRVVTFFIFQATTALLFGLCFFFSSLGQSANRNPKDALTSQFLPPHRTTPSLCTPRSLPLPFTPSQPNPPSPSPFFVHHRGERENFLPSEEQDWRTDQYSLMAPPPTPFPLKEMNLPPHVILLSFPI